MHYAPQPQNPPTATEAETATLLVSFELSEGRWILTIRLPGSSQLSRFSVPARDTAAVLAVLLKQRQRAEQHSGRPVQIVSIYEAGRDGFWLHRWLQAQEIASHVVDPASILGPQRRRKVKTDRIDGAKLLRSLAGWLSGEPGVCSMVVPPSVAQEDHRRLSRERDELVSERTRLCNRINGLLANQGIAGFKPLQKGAQQTLDDLRTGDGHALEPHLRGTLERILQRLDLLERQIKAVEKPRDAVFKAVSAEAGAITPEATMSRSLFRLRSIGPEFATVLPAECFHRHFDNRRQVAAFVGLAPTPWASGSVAREQGISKAGNRRLRRTMIELAWSWTRHQPSSALTQWFHKKVADQGKRIKRIAIVALARKLLVALWRYVTGGVVPAGAMLKQD